MPAPAGTPADAMEPHTPGAVEARREIIEKNTGVANLDAQARGAGKPVSKLQHEYTSRIAWTGNRGEGTSSYRAYDRTWDIATPGKPVVHCSNDPLLGGNPALANPEDLLLSSLAACHMLWYLHYASEAGMVVLSYQDDPVGVGETSPSGAGRFLSALLRPHIVMRAGSDLAKADAIHHRIHEVCFIARSVNFPMSCAATYATA